jgi:phosphate butyryltransferase
MTPRIPLPPEPLLLSGLEEWILRHWAGGDPVGLVFCGADEASNLKAIAHLAGKGLIRPYLLGNERLIRRELDHHRIAMPEAELIHSSNLEHCTETAIELLLSGRAHLLMRGRILMHDFLKHLLESPRRAEFIPKGSLLTHVGAFQNVHLPRIFFLSDGGIVLKPDLNQKVKIIENVIRVARLFGITQPRVALLAAVETVDSGMPSSLEDAIIAKMADRGQIKNAFIDGPLSLDAALNPEAADGKSIFGPVAGRADALIVDKIEVGNAIYKALIIFGDTLAAGLVMGAKFPIIITSRSDDLRNKILSVCLGVLALSGD